MAKPRLFVVWYYDKSLVHGYEEKDSPAWVEVKKYPVKFDLRGKAAHFVVVSNDEALTREDAISFCLAVQTGKFRVHHCDLLPCNP